MCVECLIGKQKKPILFKVTEPSFKVTEKFHTVQWRTCAIGMMITLNLRNCPPGVNFFSHWGEEEEDKLGQTKQILLPKSRFV